jgi:ferritin-like metal-binding protein YciE
MELAAYHLLGRVAFLAGDPETARVARQIEEPERSMARRLAISFDRAAEEKGPKLAGADELADAYEEHLAQTQRHAQLVGDRLRARGERPSKLKDAALTLGALNWGAFFAAQPDAPAKLAAFAYAFEHLEIAAYELLSHVAQRAGDQETTAVAAEILEDERAAASKLHSLLDEALDASLHEQGVGAR